MKAATCLATACTILATPALGDFPVAAGQKLDDTGGGLTAALLDDDGFGSAIADIGDFNGDGIGDVVVGAPGDDDGHSNAGAVYLLMLDSDGSVQTEQKISLTSGGLDPTYLLSSFGSSIAKIGDIDGNGIVDIAVGSRDALYLLFLDASGTVIDSVEHDTFSFVGSLSGREPVVTGIQDLNGDGVPDLAFAAVHKIVTVYLESDGDILAELEYVADPLLTGPSFGESLTWIGDLDGNGVAEFAVGDPSDDDGSAGAGAVWILFREPGGVVIDEQKISALEGGLDYAGPASGEFGMSVTRAGDIDGDGVRDLIVATDDDLDSGFPGDDGYVWILFLNADGTVRQQLEFSQAIIPATESHDRFGSALATRDVDGDGQRELFVGAPESDGGGVERGAVHVLFLDDVAPEVSSLGCGHNPAGSLEVVGTPALASPVLFLIDNPLGTQSVGSVGLLALSLSSYEQPVSGCGLPIPGWHMDGVSNGELSVAAPYLALLVATTPWIAPGIPARAAVLIPDDHSLIGLRIFAQGALIDPAASFFGTVPEALTESRELKIGI